MFLVAGVSMAAKSIHESVSSAIAPNKRRVVTAFVEYQQKYLLVERVATMPTYAGKWSGISGSVEQGEWPIEAVWRELKEEIGFSYPYLKFVQSGLALDIRDGEKEFRVHPFLFRWTQLPADDRTLESSIKLNSENKRFQLVDKEELLRLVDQGKTVPKLDDTFYRLVDTLERIPLQWRERARLIKEDRVSGASVLAKQVAELVRDGAPAEWVAALRPTMVSLVNISRQVSIHPEIDVVSKLEDAIQSAVEQAGRALKQSGYRHISTYSSSSTVFQLLDWCDKNDYVLHVRVAECLPEGRLFYEKAKQLGHKVELTPDSQVLWQEDRQQRFPLIITGADALLSNGDVIHRIGTRQLVEQQVLWWVLCDPFKCWRDSVPPPIEEDLFEIIPKRFIDRVFIDSNNECL